METDVSDSRTAAGHATDTPERLAFYDRIGKDNLTPLWTSLANLITPEPRSACQPAAWRFDTIRNAMMEACVLITAKEAEHEVTGGIDGLGEIALHIV